MSKDDALPAAVPRVDKAALKSQPTLERVLQRAPRTHFSLYVDFDGTLAPLVAKPEQACLPREVRGTLRRLAIHMPVAIVSGRALVGLQQKVGLPALYYAGSHGLEIEGPGLSFTPPELMRWAKPIARAQARMRRVIGDVLGLLWEEKRWGFAVHDRLVADALRPHIETTVSRISEEEGLTLQRGKRVYDVMPPLAWDKGEAVRFLRMHHEEASLRTPIYIGDDETDVHGFRAVEPDGFSMGVGAAEAARRAQFRLQDPVAVHAFLQALLRRVQRPAPQRTGG